MENQIQIVHSELDIVVDKMMLAEHRVYCVPDNVPLAVGYSNNAQLCLLPGDKHIAGLLDSGGKNQCTGCRKGNVCRALAVRQGFPECQYPKAGNRIK